MKSSNRAFADVVAVRTRFLMPNRQAIIISVVAIVLAVGLSAADPLQVTTYLNDYQMYSIGNSLQLPLTAKGGTPPYKWSIDQSTAPPGLSLGQANTAGGPGPALVGPLTEAGFWMVAVTVTDSTGASSSASLKIGVSNLRLVDGYIPAPPGQFVDVVPRISGGTPPYRIALSPTTFLPLGIRFNTQKNEFYGTAPIPHGFGVAVDITDSAANVLHTILGFGPVSGPTTDLSFGVLLDSGACGSLTVRTQTFSLVDSAMDWGDGTADPIPRGNGVLHHTYSHDGTFSLSLSVSDPAAGVRYVGNYDVQAVNASHELCQTVLRLQPHTLYLVHGTSKGQFRLDSRALSGDYHPLDMTRFTWTAADSVPFTVDQQGNVSCTGIGYGDVALVSNEVGLRTAGKVFCGEYDLEPALAQLSPVAGNNSVKLTVKATASDGSSAALNPASVQFSVGPPEKADLISLDSKGSVLVNRGPRAKSEKVTLNAVANGANIRNFSTVRVTATDLAMPVNPWRGNNVVIWFPDQMLNFNVRDILTTYDSLRVMDLIYTLEQEESGMRPSGGAMLHLANEIGYLNDPDTPCGISGNPIGLGSTIDNPQKSCFIMANPPPQRSAPQFNVWAHEAGHDFIGDSQKYQQWMSVPNSVLNFAAGESIASHHDCYALWFLSQRTQYQVPQSSLTEWLGSCAFSRTYDDLKRYQATGPDIQKIDVGGFFDIMMTLRAQYGWEAQRRFFSVFLPPDEPFPFNIGSFQQQATFIVAAYSAATRTDLRQRFKAEFGFPIDDAWYQTNYVAVDRLVSQRDPAVTAGGDVSTPPGTSVRMSQAAAFDPSGLSLTYQWSVVQQPFASHPVLSDPKLLNPTFSTDLPGTYTISLSAADALFTSRASRVNVIVAVPPKVAITGVSNNATGGSGIASGSWVSIYGTYLSATSRVWQSSDFSGSKLPTSLDGVSVTINGKSAAVYFVSPTQLNVQAPADSATGPVPVQVTNSNGTAAGTATLQPYAPGLFSVQGKYAAAVHADGVLVAPEGYFGAAVSSRPAKPGETILVFGTGFGPTTPAYRAGEIIAGALSLADPTLLQFRVGGVASNVPFAGLVAAGEYQFNVTIPALADGDQPIMAEIGGISTQPGLFITVQN
jgi:uncharacterized protein (TIGR03437 family)